MSRKKKNGILSMFKTLGLFYFYLFKAIGLIYFYFFKGIIWIFKKIGYGIARLVEYISKLPPDEKHKLVLGIQWLFSVMFILAGSLGISSSGVSMIFMIILGLVLNPKFCDFLNSKLKNKVIIDKPKRIAVGTVSLVLMCVLVPKEATQPQEIPTMIDNTQETTISATQRTTVSATETITSSITTTEELKLGFSDDKNISHITLGNPSDTTTATTTEIITTKVTTTTTTTTATTTTITTKDTSKSTTKKETQRTTNDRPITSTYVLNTNTMKFHKPTCRDVDKIIEENYSTFDGSRDEVIAMGYDPCGHCNP